MTKSFFITVFSAILLVGIVSCQGPAGPIGPQGTNGTNGIETAEDGFINFTMSGNRQDGTPFSYTESFKTYIKEDDPCRTSSDASSFYIRRSPDAASALWGTNYFNLGISKNNLGSNPSATFELSKELSPTQVFSIRCSFSSSANPNPITCIANYDATTHKLTGSFSGTIPASTTNSTWHDIVITNGSFETSVVDVIYRPAE